MDQCEESTFCEDLLSCKIKYGFLGIVTEYVFLSISPCVALTFHAEKNSNNDNEFFNNVFQPKQRDF